MTTVSKPQITLHDLSQKQDEIIEHLQTLESIFDHLICPFSCNSGKHGKGIKFLDNTVSSKNRNKTTFWKQADINDEIGKCIIEIICVEGPLNISHITNNVRAIRGKASRRIVRQRINKFLTKGYLAKTDGKVPTYRLATETV